MNRRLTGFLNIIGVLLFLAWAPGASAASWSSTVCNPPPTYGPYKISGGTKYYCPAAGSFIPTTVLTGGIASDIAKCDPNDPAPTNCFFVHDEMEMATDPMDVPNQLVQCGVPGGRTCKNPGKCGDSSDSSGIVFLNLNNSSAANDRFTSDNCIKDKSKTNPQYKCTKSHHFDGLEYDPDGTYAGLYCQNPNWRILKWLGLRLIGRNWIYYSDDPSTPILRTDLSCVLLDPENRRPGDQGYAPDLNTLTNNHYDCELQPPPEL